MSDNFEPIDLSWLRCNTDLDTIQGYRLSFLEDPSKVSDYNRNIWCNLHIIPALSSVVVEIHSLEEVAYWAKKEHLGSDKDPWNLGWPTWLWLWARTLGPAPSG